VDTPQEPSGARIVPLFPNHGAEASAAYPAPARRQTPVDTIPDDADRLLDVSSIHAPLPGEHAGLTHMRSVQLAVSSGAFYPHIATEDVPAAAARLGLNAVEIMLQTRGEYQPDFIATLGAHARASGVQIHSVHTMHHLHPHGGDRRP
jgi:hypothetical protein